jgi:hypothetical protein
VIVLDDYYTGQLTEGCDTTRYGCNQLVHALEHDPDRRVTVLPIKDRVKGGGFVQLALVTSK